MIGFVWAAAWFRWFRDEPAEHPAVSREPSGSTSKSGRLPVSARTASTPAVLGRVLADRNVVGVMPDVLHAGVRLLLQHHLAADLPGKARGFSATQLGLLAGLPLILSAVADLIGRPDDRSADADLRA